VYDKSTEYSCSHIKRNGKSDCATIGASKFLGEFIR